MEVIVLILVVIFVAVTGAGKKKQPAARQRTLNDASRLVNRAMNDARTQAQRQSAEAPVMPSNAQATFDASLAELRKKLSVAGVAPTEGGSMLDDPDCRGGSMPHAHTEGLSELEDEECAGGSMAHTHSEGVSRAAQARRMAEMDSREDEAAHGQSGLAPGAVDARALRRAVVMAEVLGKPKALKRSRFVA